MQNSHIFAKILYILNKKSLKVGRNVKVEHGAKTRIFFHEYGQFFFRRGYMICDIISFTIVSMP